MDTAAIRAEARAKLDAALAEARRWDEFLRTLDELQSGNRAQEVRVVAFASPARSGAMAETEAAAIEVIEAFGRPFPTRDLLEELRKRGIEVGGQDPIATLSARLSRSSRLENVRPYGWRLRTPRQQDEAADNAPAVASAASTLETPNDADRRGEVAHDNMTT